MPDSRERRRTRVGAESNLLAQLIHDHKNPLGIVLGYAEAMTLADPSEHAELASRLQVNARALLGVLEEFALLDDCRRRRLRLERGACNWQAIAERACAELGEMARERDQHLVCATRGPMTVQADGHRLALVMRLLLREGLRGAPRGARIVLTGAHDGAGAEMRIEIDAASPLPGGELDFDRRRPAVELAERLIALHGGTVSFAAGPGRGVALMHLPADRRRGRRRGRQPA